MTFHLGFEGWFKIFPRKKKAGITICSYIIIRQIPELIFIGYALVHYIFYIDILALNNSY